MSPEPETFASKDFEALTSISPDPEIVASTDSAERLKALKSPDPVTAQSKELFFQIKKYLQNL